MRLKEGDIIKCPDCGEEWEGLVEDYVIPSRFGVESETDEQCGYCDVWIRVVRDPDGTFDVSESEDRLSE